MRSPAGVRVPLPRKATALLAYLILEAGPHSRAHLSTLLWPESDDAHASMSLRQALSKLRDTLGDSLVADRQQVFLQRQEMPLTAACDVLHFEALLSADPMAACRVDVHRFLDDLIVDDAPEFVHWCDRTRARLTRSAVQALARASEEARAQRDWSQLLAVGERWLEFDPLSTDGACAAIEGAFLRRDTFRALAHRDVHLGLLDAEELGASAGAARVRELVRRYESVGQQSPTTGVPAVSPPLVAGEPPRHAVGLLDGALQERGDAWQRIMRCYDDACRERTSRWMTLSGGVGSGRSRLLHDALTLLVQRGARVLRAGAPRHVPQIPFGVVAQLVRSVLHADALAGVDEAHLRTLHTLVPELSDIFATLRRRGGDGAATDSTFPVRLQEALVQVMAALSEEAPVVVGLDDAMWYDRESAMTLQVVAQRVGATAMLWLATDADDVLQERENSAWAELLRSGQRIELPPFTVEAIERVLGELSGEDAGWHALAQRLHDGSHGVPGAVFSAVQALVPRWGAPHVSWQQRPLHEVPISQPSARSRAYIDGLDDVSRTVLLSLALMLERGHPVAAAAWASCPPLTLDQLSHIHGISRLRAAVVGQRLVEARLAVEVDGGFRCASPVTVDYLLTTGSALVRDELRRLLASPSIRRG